jgi:type I restriction enzyme, S subunit
MSTPALRFKDETGRDFPEWQHSTLGEIATITSGGTPSRAKSDYWDGNIPWVTTSLIDFNIIHEANEYITELGLKSSSAKVFPKNTLLMAMYGQGKTRGKVAVLGVEATTNQACAAILLTAKVNTAFAFQNLAGRYDEIRELSNSGGQENLSAGLIKEISLSYPSLPEQTKIANFLTAVDEKITQLTQKCDLLAQYKKGVMQQIFSQQLRFKDDDGRDFPEWEEKQADEIFKTHVNKNHNGELPILAATQDKGMIYREDTGLDIKSSKESIQSYKIVEKGDFVISLRSFQGGIEYSKIMGICSPAYIVMKPIVKIVDDFYKDFMKKDDFIERLNGLTIGIRDGKQISFSAFSTLTLPYPSIQEQTKIANFLTVIDDKANNAQAQLAAVKQYKQGLLQQMFV